MACFTNVLQKLILVMSNKDLVLKKIHIIALQRNANKSNYWLQETDK